MRNNFCAFFMGEILMATKKKETVSKKKGGTKKGNHSLGRRIAVFFAKCVLCFFILTIGFVLLYRFVPVYYTPLMFIRLYQQHAEDKPLKLQRDWEPIENISKNMPLAVVASEDGHFLQHNGFDIDGIIKAYEHNKKKKKVHGGSTISQQTAKNVFLYPSRSYVRKGLEAYFTILIEFCWSKERIMEVYLNVIEMGDGIYGIEEASCTYFKCSAKDLTRSQAASIAVCLPNPRKYSPVKSSSYIQKRRRRIEKEMKYIGKIDFSATKEEKPK